MSALEKFFCPGSVAVVGASRTPGKAGHTIVRNILEFGFRGDIYPVNPGCEEILGLRSYASIGDLPGPVDLAIGVLPRRQTLDLIDECAHAGVRSLIIPAAGFSDVGDEGRELEREVMAAARAAGIRVMGPNSIGTVCTGCGIATPIVTLDRMRPGGVSLFGQTGMLASGFARWIQTSEWFGINKIACLGNKADLDENDMLEYLAADDTTRVIGFYTEGVSDGRRFAEALRTAAGAKPVLVLKSGRTAGGRKAIASHTGALAGSDEVYSGLIEQCGARRVADFEELFDCAKALEWQPLPAGDGVGIVSITGLGCVLAADTASRYGLRFPAPAPRTVEAMRGALPDWVPASNPADIWAAIEARGPKEAYGLVASALADDPGVHSLIAIFTLIPESSLDVMELFGPLAESHPEKPLAAVLMSGDALMYAEWKRTLEGNGIPAYHSPERALRALGTMRAVNRKGKGAADAAPATQPARSITPPLGSRDVR
ncbi:MAG: CoA-binding protein [Actinomycetota bacterium]